jgi:anti-sigma factor RsiW
MDCLQVQDRLVAFAAGRLEAVERDELARHFETCAACAEAVALERDLTSALARLPRYRAPEALKRRSDGADPAGRRVTAHHRSPRQARAGLGVGGPLR